VYPRFYNGGGSRGGEPGQEVWGTKVPQWGPEAVPVMDLEDEVPISRSKM